MIFNNNTLISCRQILNHPYMRLQISPVNILEQHNHCKHIPRFPFQRDGGLGAAGRKGRHVKIIIRKMISMGDIKWGERRRQKCVEGHADGLTEAAERRDESGHQMV